MAENQSSAKADDVQRITSGFGAFASRVLEQLGVTSWLPAAMLIGVGALLVELHHLKTFDISGAVGELANPKSWGIVIVLVFALILTTMITQAFSFGIIRTLEGYWGPSRPLDRLVVRRVRAKVSRGRKARGRVTDLDRRLFETARQRLLQEEDRDHVDVWEAQVYQIPQAERRQQDAALIAEANEIEWREKADPALAALYYRAQARVEDFPRTETRYLPTDLGNVLRASEERLGSKGSSLERFVMDNYHAFPARLMTQHDQFRDRLDMYSLLVLVFSILAVGAVPLLIHWGQDATVPGKLWEILWSWTPPISSFVVLSSLSWLSYRAAIASARGYGSALSSMNKVLKEIKAAQPTKPAAPPSQTS
jgi:hypothetical protein